MTDRLAAEGDLVGVIAKTIHDARCGGEAAHQEGRYWACVRFYVDHAKLALDAIDDVGLQVVAKPVIKTGMDERVAI